MIGEKGEKRSVLSTILCRLSEVRHWDTMNGFQVDVIRARDGKPLDGLHYLYSG